MIPVGKDAGRDAGDARTGRGRENIDIWEMGWARACVDDLRKG